MLRDEVRELPGSHVCFDANFECAKTESALANRWISIIAQHEDRNGLRLRLRSEPPQCLEAIHTGQTIVQANKARRAGAGYVEALLAVSGNYDLVPRDLQAQPVHVGDNRVVIDDEDLEPLSGRLSPPRLCRPFVIGIAAPGVIDNGPDGCHPVRLGGLQTNSSVSIWYHPWPHQVSCHRLAADPGRPMRAMTQV